MIGRLCLRLALLVLLPSVCFGEELYRGINHVHVQLRKGSIDAILIDRNAGEVKIISSLSKFNSRRYGFPTRAVMTLSDYAIATDALVVLSGGFLTSFSPPTPLGEITIDGQQISQRHNSWLTTGVFCTGNGGRKITEVDSEVNAAGIDCLQSGPLFIRNGKMRYNDGIDLSKAEISFAKSVEEQAFICVTVDHKLILGVSTAMNFEELSPALKELHCVDSLGLSGGQSVGMYYNGSLVGNDSEPLTSTIAVFPAP